LPATNSRQAPQYDCLADHRRVGDSDDQYKFYEARRYNDTHSVATTRRGREFSPPNPEEYVAA